MKKIQSHAIFLHSPCLFLAQFNNLYQFFFQMYLYVDVSEYIVVWICYGYVLYICNYKFTEKLALETCPIYFLWAVCKGLGGCLLQ